MTYNLKLFNVLERTFFVDYKLTFTQPALAAINIIGCYLNDSFKFNDNGSLIADADYHFVCELFEYEKKIIADKSEEKFNCIFICRLLEVFVENEDNFNQAAFA